MTALVIVSMPTFFFLSSHFFYPAGAATFITGPFAHLYGFLIVVTGFFWNMRLSLVAAAFAAASYFGVYLLAYVPRAWFYIMDKRLLALPHIQGNLDKVNIDPDARSAIFLRYGRDKMEEPTLTGS